MKTAIFMSAQIIFIAAVTVHYNLWWALEVMVGRGGAR